MTLEGFTGAWQNEAAENAPPVLKQAWTELFEARSAVRKAENRLRRVQARVGRRAELLTDGVTVRFDKNTLGRNLTYLAVRVDGRWYLTGRMSRGISDEEFLAFIDKSSVHLLNTVKVV